MTALAKTSVASLPTALPAPLRRSVDVLVTKLDPPFSPGNSGHSIAAADAPGPETRAALRMRLDHVEGWLRPCGPDAATREYKLLCTMAMPPTDPEPMALEMFGFVEAAARLPLFALQEACTAFRLGRIGDGKWMPKTGEVVREAERRLAALARERQQLDAVLTAKVRAPVVDPARRAEVAESIRAASASIAMAGATAERKRMGSRAGEPDPVPPPPETLEELRDRMRAMPSPTLSQSAARTMGVRTRDEVAA